MTPSDSLPIQFWATADSTFNETDVCGLVKQDCFCQPWTCTDSTFLQFTNVDEVAIKAYNGAGTLLSEITFYEAPLGVWNADIHFSLFGCQDINFIVGSYTNFLLNNSFAASLSPWTQSALGVAPWTWDASNAAKANFAANTDTEQLIQTFSTKAAGKYKYSITYKHSTPPSPTSVNISVQAFNGAVFVQTLFSVSSITFYRTANGTVTASGDFDRIKIVASDAFGVPQDYNVLIADVSLDSFVLSHKSDCLNLKTTQDCTKLIQYSNSSNFDGIDYSDLSPGRVFYLRIPATFYEESNPQEQEDMELSNGQIVTIRQGIQQKKKLDIGYMPPYMHLKVQKVLMHETVTIDGTQWRRRDPYNSPNIPKYNLKKGDVLLTKYNSVEKNTI